MDVARTATLLQQSANTWWDMGEDCFTQAKAQDDLAERLHATAAQLHKDADKAGDAAKQLNAFGQALQANAIEITKSAP
jgi:hypothetical protein